MKKPILAAALSALLAAPLPAALLTHYDFTDGNLTDNEIGASYTLALTGSVTINPDGSAHFPGDEASPAYLDVKGPGGKPNFIVSFWWKTDSFDQGDYQALFSNNVNTGSYTWQLDHSGADMRLVSTGNTILTYPESNLTVGTWYHTVIRKSSTGTAARIYITPENAASPSVVMSGSYNPGGLQYFRLGVNRNSDKLFRMDMANVKIYDESSDALVSTLLAEGPQLVPEPSSLFLALLGLSSLAVRRKRRN